MKTPIHIICELEKFKLTSPARLALYALSTYGIENFTKKFVMGLFTGEPKLGKRAIEILSLCNIINFKTGEYIGEPNYDYFNKVEEEKDSSFSWKYGKAFHTTYKTYGAELQKIASSKRYDEDEYFELLYSRVLLDKFWAKVVTQEMVLRKIVMLEKIFGLMIPKKVGDMKSVADIF